LESLESDFSDPCTYVIDYIRNGLSSRLGIEVLVKETNVGLKGLLAYVNVLETLIKGKCVIKISRIFRLVTSNCLDNEYVLYVLAHEACHCVNSRKVMLLISLLILITLVYALIIPNNLFIDLVAALVLIRTGLFIRLISEYLADKCVLSNFGLSYVRFLRRLSKLENVRSSKLLRLILKIVNQPTARERLDILESKWGLIKKYFYL